MGFYMNIKGMNRLLEMLDHIPGKVEEIEKEILEESAQLVKSDAESRLTVSGKGLALKDNIQISNIFDENNYSKICVGVFWDSSIPGVINQAELFYAPYHHFGTVHTTANPFLQAAYQSNKRKITKIARVKLKEAIGNECRN